MMIWFLLIGVVLMIAAVIALWKVLQAESEVEL